MKRVTITYTRPNEETPWYWQVAPTALNPMNAFLDANVGQLDTYAYDYENQNIVTFTFENEQIYQEFRTLIETNVASDYLQYCQDNNITIGVVTEDV
jgi:hypothetical protein